MGIKICDVICNVVLSGMQSHYFAIRYNLVEAAKSSEEEHKEKTKNVVEKVSRFCSGIGNGEYSFRLLNAKL